MNIGDLNSICQPDIIDIIWSSSSKRKLSVLPQCIWNVLQNRPYYGP